MRNTSGYSLFEILISLALASLISLIISQIYLMNKKQYYRIQRSLEIELDKQWISDLLTNSVRRSGFTPCLGVDQLEIVDRRNTTESITGLKIQTTPRQLIQINRMSELFTELSAIKSANQLVLVSTKGLQELRPLLIADCEHGEIQQITKIAKDSSGSLVTLAQPLLFSYSSRTYVGEWIEEQWYIKKNARGLNALYYKYIRSEELTTAVHSLLAHKKNKQQLVELLMGIEQGKTHRLLVAVRGS